MKIQRGYGEILNNFDNPIFKLKTISELLFIESANDGKILNADASNGVSLMIADLATEIETLSDELHVKLSAQILEEIERKKAALQQEVAAETQSPA